MNKTVPQLISLCLALLGLPVLAHAQSEFDNAHALLQKLADDSAAAKNLPAKTALQNELGTIPYEAENLIEHGIVNLLNSGSVRSPEDLHIKISTAVQSEVQSENATGVFVFALGPPAKRSYAVVYNIAFCAVCSRSWVGVFALESGQYRVVASLENSLANQSLTAVPLSVGDDTIRFLVSGTNWGDAHNRLNVAAYFFDGHRVVTAWSRVGLPQGTIEVRRGAIVLSFLTSLRPPWKRRREVYSLSKEEIQLQSATETPEN